MIKTKNSYENFNDSGCSMEKFNQDKADLKAQDNLKIAKLEVASQKFKQAKDQHFANLGS